MVGACGIFLLACAQKRADSPASAISPAATRPVATTPAPPRIITPFKGIRVIQAASPADSRIEIDAWVCLDEGWLEQVACSPRTREHESLLVVKAQPSNIHAALLMAGFESGTPGRWKYENENFTFVPPTGSALEVMVRYAGADSETIERSVRAWIREARNSASFPDDPWIFSGSRFEPNPEFMGPGEHYVADMTGSIIGLVTFGDEVVGFSRVMAHEEAVQPLEWEANPDTMPPIGTPVTVILRAYSR